MQKRSLFKVFLYNSLSLGLYELIWLQQTRQELMRLTNIRIPRIEWLVVLNLLRLAGLVTALVLASMLFAVDQPPAVSQSCWAEYTLSQAPETASQVLLTDECKQLVETNEAASDRQDSLIRAYLWVIVLLLVSSIGYPRWLRNYGLAAQQVTGGKLSQTTAMYVLVFAPSFGVVTLQSAFNTVSELPQQTSPAGALPYQSTENKTVHKTLSIIATLMALAFGLFILFLIVVAALAKI